LYNDWGQVNQLGILYISADEISRAKELLEMFISKDPENEKASLAREILKSLNREF
jgi:Tfp pilus assembly protein PilF